ncbi:uncharacterized protein LOC108095019 [Drosophila ficusphila]|uniref:uncharacterized protein LOC108095019 n=1 Tax=Drosophila ficusphila TaxID=30025 RepID=UPI0007E88F64|nr:uncharacterized protein LOC108095019 [Drosophila ficusphila]
MNYKPAEMQSIDKAKNYFSESGILGPTNFESSRDLIRKTSTIHNNTTLKNQIRNTSVCLRSRVSKDKSATKSYDDSLILLQNEICNIKNILVHGDTKIIVLRTEIGKLKQALQAIINVQKEDRNCSPEIVKRVYNPTPSPCLFCQP